MKTKEVQISTLRHPEKNVRNHSDYQLQELYKSVQMFGQIRPIVIDETGLILAGNGLVESFRMHDKKTVTALQVAGLSEDQKKKLMIADNRIYSLGSDNRNNLMEMLESLDDFVLPGYEEDTLKEIFAEAESELVNDKAVHNYGLINEDHKNEMERARERKQELEANYDPHDYQEEYNESLKQTPAEPLTEYGKPLELTKESYITCPHCGGKVQL